MTIIETKGAKRRITRIPLKSSNDVVDFSDPMEARRFKLIEAIQNDARQDLAGALERVLSHAMQLLVEKLGTVVFEDYNWIVQAQVALQKLPDALIYEKELTRKLVMCLLTNQKIELNGIDYPVKEILEKLR